MLQTIDTIMKGAIIGDAAGYTLNALKKTHIHGAFRELDGFPDTTQALRHDMGKWRKPGLYSSITQFLLLAAACTENRYFNSTLFTESVKTLPELQNHEFSYFRSPGAAERFFLESAGNRKPEICFTQPCSRIIPISLALLLSGLEMDGLTLPAFEFVSLFTTDPSTAVCSAVFISLIDQLNNEDPGLIAETAASVSDRILTHLQSNQHVIFNMGFNPDYVIDNLVRLKTLFHKLDVIKDPDNAEKIICNEINLTLKTPVTRASVNLPALVLPFAVSIASYTVNPEDVTFRAAGQGGTASSLASIAAAIRASVSRKSWPDSLEEGLVNKKKLSGMISEICSGHSRHRIINELTVQEPALTMKEYEEFLAKNKKSVRNTPQKNNKQSEKILSRHVVESWTKIDKARWKKEKNRKTDD